MTESKDSESKSSPFLNWLTTTQGIVVSLAAILGAVVTIATILDLSPKDKDAASETSQNDPTEIFKPETFSVPAGLTTGYTYTYPKTEKPAKLEYVASGRWIAIPIATQGNMPKGEIDANGYSGWGSNPSKPCPAVNLGALAVTTESNQCLTVGAKGSFDAEPGASYKFVMNDAFDMYKDNEGAMVITLYKKTTK